MFDSVLWDYIEEVMSYMGFGDHKWRCWIRQSISTSIISNLVNGSLREEFGIVLGQNGLRISHLQFADDTLISSYDKSASIQNVKRILQCSELVSGLKVNFFESTSIGFGPDSEIISDMALSLRCKVESLHSMYLGLPIRKPAINRISRRLTSWKERSGLFCGLELKMVRKSVKSSGDTMILPKDHGGLGIGSVLAMNKALFLEMLKAWF
ncbi:uncharacterized protein [Populus alba]|uniref:uncharacterized protein n=1 Tax=Populus alba TaxID=43335 RepID=UPI003CC72FAE